ncbi:spermidine acetyltransferase [Micromonospora humidisoli]|uniref:GNAT family N-acetyltransferase n=1 Tax=Micromonospora humidisoli TaxID=2807622 RepID=A0ABS2J506_9ACTN|nr:MULTISPECIES: GNAT family N-acetyltransferase [Micromonospora]MBM7081637.1 GNAT family N-acetyltransferase [Micromonospora humidisoli]GHJ09542.1 spermidine acetyltransferase [Micromonospora sp. AKA109]
MLDSGHTDRLGRRVTLRPVDDDNWRAVADLAPRDDQRDWVPALAARYLVLTARSEVWTSLAVHADETVAGHVMWGVDDDGSRWIGGMLIDAAEQGRGVGRAAVRTLADWLGGPDGGHPVRLSYHPDNTAAARLYTALGFVPTGVVEDDELVAELRR